ncbi:hypothetical protein IU436_07090 [Nocardia farcinica]|uniref:hypothetical protein n=1 Tax=Nocardia farcinica TaxID=37329 RepID=UPI001894B7DA|nr:hypothetical protein [Nocardia farcinica]MBF6418634.1 hypothetical protein [Nocardia farcinica]MBF6430111.1 hypothetical protein [Nocardia farcinica]MBF6504480.1 hypothetical protein [Nocardia farcinica]MBF6523870.1 hypothetical protein [Nocardia farcinica]
MAVECRRRADAPRATPFQPALRVVARRRREAPPRALLIFPSFEWTLRDPVNVNHQWQRVREALGLPDDLSPYAFRKLIALVLDDEGLSARVTADVLQHADPAMTQRKYMARGRVHHDAAAVVHKAVMDGLRADDRTWDGNGPRAPFRTLSGRFPGSDTNPAPGPAR